MAFSRGVSHLTEACVLGMKLRNRRGRERSECARRRMREARATQTHMTRTTPVMTVTRPKRIKRIFQLAMGELVMPDRPKAMGEQMSVPTPFAARKYDVRRPCSKRGYHWLISIMKAGVMGASNLRRDERQMSASGGGGGRRVCAQSSLGETHMPSRKRTVMRPA